MTKMKIHESRVYNSVVVNIPPKNQWQETQQDSEICSKLSEKWKAVRELNYSKKTLVPPNAMKFFADWLCKRFKQTKRRNNTYFRRIFKKTWMTLTNPAKKKFYNLYRANKRDFENQKLVIEEKIFVLLVEIRELTQCLKSKPKKKMIEFYNYFAKVDGAQVSVNKVGSAEEFEKENTEDTPSGSHGEADGDAVDGTNGEESREAEDADVSADATTTAVVTKNGAADAEVLRDIVNVFPANYKSVEPTYDLEVDWGEDEGSFARLTSETKNLEFVEEERVEDPATLVNYTANDKENIKRKIATKVNQTRITQYFTAKKPRIEIPQVAVEIPQVPREPNMDNNVINCFCDIPAFKNYVTSKAKHIKNFGRPYYYCSKKLAKPVGVKRSSVSAADLAIYDDACHFYIPPESV